MTEAKEMAPMPESTGAVESVEESLVALTPAVEDGAAINAAGSPLEGVSAVDLVRMLKDAEGRAKTIKAAAEEFAEAFPYVSKQAFSTALWAFCKEVTPSERRRYETDPEPWPESVNLLELIREIEAIVSEVMECSPAVATAVSYFCLCTWFFDYTNYAAYFCVTAATHKSGKSTLLRLMNRISRRPYSIGPKPTEAVAFRAIDAYSPTLFCDEVDTYLKEAEALQGVFNCGIERGDEACVTRNEKDRNGNYVLRQYDCFGFKAFGGIQADGVGRALMSRAIVVTLKPAKNIRAKKTRIRDIDPERFDSICRKCARVAEDLGPRVEKLKREERPEFPDSFDGRDCDKWELIFTVARFAGDEELKRVKDAAVSLEGDKPDDPDWKIELLTDIRQIYWRAISDKSRTGFDYQTETNERKRFSLSNDAIGSAILNDALKADTDKPWGTWGRSPKGLTVGAQSKALSAFGVKTENIRFSKEVKKGYRLTGPHGLLEAFKAFLGPLEEPEKEAA